jgi:hypothetical protein
MNNLFAEQASSVIRLLPSLREKYLQLLRVGDASSTRPRDESGKTNRKYEEAKELYLAGMSAPKAAEKVGMPYNTLAMMLSKRGVNKGRRQALTEEDCLAIRADLEAGLRWKEVTPKYSCTNTGYKRACQRLGLVPFQKSIRKKL